jgi:hypothetical protein
MLDEEERWYQRVIAKMVEIFGDPHDCTLADEEAVEKARGTPFSNRGFQAMVERVARAAGFDIKIHPHMLRHSCGYKLANDGVDTRTIQGYLGHKSIQHTVRYTERRRASRACSGTERHAQNAIAPNACVHWNYLNYIGRSLDQSRSASASASWTFATASFVQSKSTVAGRPR